MGFRADLYSALTGDAGLAALVGTRLYPEQAPQDPVLPYIVYYEFANPRQQTLTGALAVGKPRIQYSIYAETASGALSVADALRAAILATGYMVVFEDERGNNEMTSSLSRRDVDVRFAHVE